MTTLVAPRGVSWRLLLWYAVVALLAAELGFRLFWAKRLVLGAGIEHPHFHHRLLPNTDYHFKTTEFDVTIHTNHFGLRGAEPVSPKPAGVTRLLLMGDSYIFGFPVADQDTAGAFIERRLRVDGYPVEVINAGVSGYSPTLQYISLRDQFLDFEPDLVVLWYDVGDLTEDLAFQKNLLLDRDGRILRCDPRFINGRYAWWEAALRHSALARYVNNKILRTIGKIKILGLSGYLKAALRGERAKVAIARLKRAQQAEDLAAYDKFALVRPGVTVEQLSPMWKLSASYLDKIRALCEERGIPLVLGAYPYGMLAGPEEWGDGRVYWGFEKGRTYDADAYLALLGDYAAQRRLVFINAFPRFRAAVGTAPLFYNWDGHFTPAGQRVLAEALIENPSFVALLDQVATSRR